MRFSHISHTPPTQNVAVAFDFWADAEREIMKRKRERVEIRMMLFMTELI